jgi:ATP-dependent helicase/nuclease subunit A
VRLLPPLPRVPAAAAAATAATDERAARHGEALHRLLEWAADAPPHRRPALAEAAAAAFGLGPEAVDALLAQAGRVLDGPAHRFFDRAALAWAGNEVTLADGEQLLRVDRLVAFDDLGGRTWWVLDYKLQPAPQRVPAYVAQLQRYRALLQRLQPDDGVRAAFVTAAGEVVELAPGDAPPRRSAPGR